MLLGALCRLPSSQYRMLLIGGQLSCALFHTERCMDSSARIPFVGQLQLSAAGLLWLLTTAFFCRVELNHFTQAAATLSSPPNAQP